MQDDNESTTVLWWGPCIVHCCPCVTSFQSNGGVVKVVLGNVYPLFTYLFPLGLVNSEDSNWQFDISLT